MGELQFTKERCIMTQTEMLELLRADPERGIRTVISAFSALSEKTILHLAGGVLRPEDVEELVSDVFLQVYRSRETIAPEKGSLATFIITLSKRRATDALRRKRDPVKTPLPLEDAVLPDALPSPETEVLLGETRRRLVRAIAALGHPDSTIVFRRYYYGESYAEIGKRLGMTENAVNKRCLKAKEKLRHYMEGEEDAYV